MAFRSRTVQSSFHINVDRTSNIQMSFSVGTAVAIKNKPHGPAGRDEPRRVHTKGPTARHPITCGSIPQHNTLEHQDSTEPMHVRWASQEIFQCGLSGTDSFAPQSWIQFGLHDNRNRMMPLLVCYALPIAFFSMRTLFFRI